MHSLFSYSTSIDMRQLGKQPTHWSPLEPKKRKKNSETKQKNKKNASLTKELNIATSVVAMVTFTNKSTTKPSMSFFLLIFLSTLPKAVSTM